eukprot:358605-Chlamydomonas_euryale.AAC.10
MRRHVVRTAGHPHSAAAAHRRRSHGAREKLLRRMAERRAVEANVAQLSAEAGCVDRAGRLRSCVRVVAAVSSHATLSTCCSLHNRSTHPAPHIRHVHRVGQFAGGMRGRQEGVGSWLPGRKRRRIASYAKSADAGKKGAPLHSLSCGALRGGAPAGVGNAALLQRLRLAWLTVLVPAHLSH